MIMQPVGYARPIGQFEDSTVVNNSGTDVTAAQRNDPAPPTVTHEMIGRPRTRRSARVGVIRIFLAPIITVPVLNAGEPRPNRVDRMIKIRPVPAELAGQKRGSAAGIDQPTRRHGAFAAIHSY